MAALSFFREYDLCVHRRYGIGQMNLSGHLAGCPLDRHHEPFCPSDHFQCVFKNGCISNRSAVFGARVGAPLWRS